MRRIAKINIDQSVSLQKLVFEEEWLDKFDRIVIYLFFSGLVVYPILSIMGADFNNNNDKLFSLVIFPLVILFGLYVIYRKATEKILFKINTPFDWQKNRLILLEYAVKQQFEIYRKSNNCLIFNESISDFNPRYKKSMIFIVKDNVIFFTILKEQFKLNLPTLTSHLYLKSDLKKLLRQSDVAVADK